LSRDVGVSRSFSCRRTADDTGTCECHACRPCHADGRLAFQASMKERKLDPFIGYNLATTVGKVRGLQVGDYHRHCVPLAPVPGGQYICGLSEGQLVDGQILTRCTTQKYRRKSGGGLESRPGCS
jgi:hypothetical protein